MEEIESNLNKLLLEIELKPVQGDRFQPTGFPNLGAAVYETPDNKRNILLESPQSMANRFEKICMKGEGPYIDDELKGLSYILVHLQVKSDKDNAGFDAYTSSLVEAHRLNSPFIIKNTDFREKFKQKTKYQKGKIGDWHQYAKAVFYYDINSLIHGIFFSNFEDGRIKFPRVLSSFIEAINVNEAESGGTKFNAFDPSGVIVIKGDTKNVYGNVPYQKTEYTAGYIKAYFNLDIELIKSYRLDKSAEDLLINLSLYKITKFLETGLRLRTACDLTTNGKLTATNSSIELKDSSYYLSCVKKLINDCKDKNLFAGSPLEITTEAVVKDKKSDKNKNEDNNDSDQN